MSEITYDQDQNVRWDAQIFTQFNLKKKMNLGNT
jgi:hypothetical protein